MQFGRIWNSLLLAPGSLSSNDIIWNCSTSVKNKRKESTLCPFYCTKRFHSASRFHHFFVCMSHKSCALQWVFSFSHSHTNGWLLPCKALPALLGAIIEFSVFPKDTITNSQGVGIQPPTRCLLEKPPTFWATVILNDATLQRQGY